MKNIKEAFPPGHFYSNIPDLNDLLSRKNIIWSKKNSTIGIDYNDYSHINILDNIFPKYIDNFDYPDDGVDDDNLNFFYNKNSQFSWLDSKALFVLLQHFKPSSIIEVGSGYSTLLMNDVNKRFLNSSVRIKSIEPFPRSFLNNLIVDIELKKDFVQNVNIDYFKKLSKNDILFIDSSHISKIGSDVNHLYLNIIPNLNPGVILHIHDIFLPEEYKFDWVESGIFFNEQYLVQLMLSFTKRYEVIFSSNYSYISFPKKVAAALRVPVDNIYGGGSIWIRIID